jgi:DNA mismatch endonuclease, patch repair protein
VFVKRRVAVFVDGCFWHGCPSHGVRPKSNGRFWTRKLRKNKERDKEVNEILTSEGWTVMRYWEHQIEQDMGNVIRSVVKAVRRSAGGRAR